MNTGVFALDRFGWGLALMLVLDLAALTSIWKSRKHALKAKIIWTAMVALLPLFGAIAWFALGREPRAAR
jgi:hypothetical protein